MIDSGTAELMVALLMGIITLIWAVVVWRTLKRLG
jgi:hypothetical protein